MLVGDVKDEGGREGGERTEMGQALCLVSFRI